MTATTQSLSPDAGLDGTFASEQFTVAVLVQRGKLFLLEQYLSQVRKSDTMRGVTITVVYPKSVAEEVQEITEALPRVRLLQAAGMSIKALALTLADDAGFHFTPYLTAHVLGYGDPGKVFEQTLQAARWWGGLGWGPEALSALDGSGPSGQYVPLLLPTSHTPRDLTMLYVDRVRTLPCAEGESWSDYLGHLTLRGAMPKLEAVDRDERGITLRIALDSRALRAEPAPAWRFRVILRDKRGDRMVSEPVTSQQRSAKVGADSWDDLVAFLPLTDTSSGPHELLLELATPVEALRGQLRMKPRIGALVPSRPVALPGLTADEQPGLRYLVHPSSDGNRSMLTIQRGQGLAAKARWMLRMVAMDAAFIFGLKGQLRMRWLRLLRLITLPLYFWRRPWLVGERFDTAQDNGMHLFRYLRGSKHRNRVYYVIDRRSPQRESVADLGHLVNHSSWRHQLYLLHARVVADAYSLHYLFPQQWKVDKFVEQMAWRTGSLQVFLQHGVHMSPRAVRRGSTGYDLMITTTERETEALREVSGYDAQLAETGMPRYDALRPGDQSRTILFMSTWRQYLVPKLFGSKRQAQVPFEGSAYHAFMSGFLADPRLQAMLDQHDYKLVMMPHYNMAEFFTDMPIPGDRVVMADPGDGISMQDHIRNCDGFITDYSSVHFDVAYLNTPVIYARFDEHDYETRHASAGWFDYDAEGFGPVARTLDETLDALEEMVATGCRQPDHYQQRVEQAFTHHDYNNSQRVVARIESELTSQS